MEDVKEDQLQIQGSPKTTTADIESRQSPFSSKENHFRWWLTLAICTCLVLAGQTMGTLLGRFYYNQGGNSKWMGTIVTTAGFPILLPILLFSPRSTFLFSLNKGKILLIYIGLGLIGAINNLMYSYGLLYLPVSTFSLVCATQLAFNVVFSYFLNSQKLTSLIINSAVLLTFSAALLGVDSYSESTSHISKAKYPLGYLLTLVASAIFSLSLSLTQLTFQKVVKREGFAVVLECLVCTSFVSTAVSLMGLFVSGEWRGLRSEMDGFGKGKGSYLMTLISIAISWTISGVGGVGLMFTVSSLFSNIISTMALPLVPLFAVAFFHDRMDGVKIVAMMIAVWGFLSYIYQDYLDSLIAKKKIVLTSPLN